MLEGGKELDSRRRRTPEPSDQRSHRAVSILIINGPSTAPFCLITSLPITIILVACPA